MILLGFKRHLQVLSYTGTGLLLTIILLMVLEACFINGNIQANKINSKRFLLPTLQNRLSIIEIYTFRYF